MPRLEEENDTFKWNVDKKFISLFRCCKKCYTRFSNHCIEQS